MPLRRPVAPRDISVILVSLSCRSYLQRQLMLRLIAMLMVMLGVVLPLMATVATAATTTRHGQSVVQAPAVTQGLNVSQTHVQGSDQSHQHHRTPSARVMPFAVERPAMATSTSTSASTSALASTPISTRKHSGHAYGRPNVGSAIAVHPLQRTGSGPESRRSDGSNRIGGVRRSTSDFGMPSAPPKYSRATDFYHPSADVIRGIPIPNRVTLPVIREFDLTLTNSPCAPDGFVRSCVLANGQFPAPTLVVNMFDRVRITVRNRLVDPGQLTDTTIHWHGLHMRGSNDMDGVSDVTQCPIPTGTDFVYDFIVDQAGTFWYHSHHSVQYLDGLRGVLISLDNDPHRALYDIDRPLDGGPGEESTILFLGDWHHHPSVPLRDEYQFITHKEPMPDSAFINGLGRCKLDCPQRRPKYTLTVRQGLRYLLRVINSSGMLPFTFSIDGHAMTILHTEANPAIPHTVSEFDIYPGQRYAVVIHANKTIGNYWIRAKAGEVGVPGFVRNNPNFDSDVRGILRYEGAPLADPVSDEEILDVDVSPLDIRDLSAFVLPDPRLQGNTPPDVKFELRFREEKNDTDAVEWTINDVAHRPSAIPTLLRVLRGGTFLNDFPVTINPQIILQPNSVVDVAISGGAGGFLHPIHLHGHDFAVLSERKDENQRPQMRDTIQTGGREVVFRFIADNPGVWFMHCHIDWHLDVGFAVEFISLPQLIRQTITPPPEWFQLCQRQIQQEDGTQAATKSRSSDRQKDDKHGVDGGGDQQPNDNCKSDKEGISQSAASTATSASVVTWIIAGVVSGMGVVALAFHIHSRRHAPTSYDVVAPEMTQQDGEHDNEADALNHSDSHFHSHSESHPSSFSPSSVRFDLSHHRVSMDETGDRELDLEVEDQKSQ